MEGSGEGAQNGWRRRRGEYAVTQIPHYKDAVIHMRRAHADINSKDIH